MSLWTTLLFFSKIYIYTALKISSDIILELSWNKSVILYFNRNKLNYFIIFLKSSWNRKCTPLSRILSLNLHFLGGMRLLEYISCSVRFEKTFDHSQISHDWINSRHAESCEGIKEASKLLCWIEYLKQCMFFLICRMNTVLLTNCFLS